MSDKTQLLGMGFSETKVEKALKVTKSAGLQPALDWLFAHADEPDDAPLQEEEEENEEAKIKRLDNEGEAKSLKCSDCGKAFRTTASAEFHASKTGHENFEESTEEIKPLTEEEKKKKLEELRAAMAVKRAKQELQDKEDAKQNEAIRRKAGKDTSAAKEEMKLKEAEKEARQRVADKKADQIAKDRIRQQIEEDKKARAEKAAREKALRAGQPIVDASASVKSGPSTVAAQPKSTSATARLQIRLPDDSPPLVTSLPSSKTLQDAINWVEEQRPDLAGYKYSTTFPRKTFTDAEKSKSLTDLGLAPSSVLMMQR